MQTSTCSPHGFCGSAFRQAAGKGAGQSSAAGLGGWGSSRLWAQVFTCRWLAPALAGRSRILSMWAALCDLGARAHSGLLPAWPPCSEDQRPGEAARWGCGLFMTSAAFSGRSLREERQRIWGTCVKSTSSALRPEQLQGLRPVYRPTTWRCPRFPGKATSHPAQADRLSCRPCGDRPVPSGAHLCVFVCPSGQRTLVREGLWGPAGLLRGQQPRANSFIHSSAHHKSVRRASCAPRYRSQRARSW